MSREQRLEALLREVRVLLERALQVTQGALHADIEAALPQQAEASAEERAAWIDANVSGKPHLIQVMKNIAGCAEAEPAPAQDEREAFEVEARKLLYVLSRDPSNGEYIVPDTEDAWKLWQARATRPAQTEQQPIGVTAVAVTREKEDGELYLDWLLEGGICELEFAGQVLVVADQPITDDEGHGEVYAAPIAQTEQEPWAYGWESRDKTRAQVDREPHGGTWFPLYRQPVQITRSKGGT